VAGQQLVRTRHPLTILGGWSVIRKLALPVLDLCIIANVLIDIRSVPTSHGTAQCELFLGRGLFGLPTSPFQLKTFGLGNSFHRIHLRGLMHNSHCRRHL